MPLAFVATRTPAADALPAERPTAVREAAWALAAWLLMLLIGSIGLPAETLLRSLLLAPLCEEIVWRWGLQDRLSTRFGTRGAVWLSAAAFGLAHALFAAGTPDVWRALATALPAAFIGQVYARIGRLLPCVAWHAGFNLIWWLAPPSLSAWLIH